ncbi:MAG: esterase-like activity of phytase family protein [Planctomycetota bacterium]
MIRPLRIGGALALVACLFLAFNAGADDDDDDGKKGGKFFRRLATFPVFENTDESEETAAEIIAASKDGKTLIYTDSETNRLGFVDIRNPSNPKPDGTIALPGEPTSVAVKGRFALVCVNTSADFVNTSGDLLVINIRNRRVVRTIPLGGQPDSIAVSPDEKYAAIAIENERDEDLGDGRPPQLPAGFVVVVDLSGRVRNWTTKQISLIGIPDKFPTDPEPEYIDINKQNIAVVSLQENNHLVLIDLERCKVICDYPAGTVDLDDVDIFDDRAIRLEESLDDLEREPDAVHWVSDYAYATANEGDLDGGSRGFSIFNKYGRVKFDAAESLEYAAISLGHYNDTRSDNKGNEPEGLEFARFGKRNLLFVGSERGNFTAVYELHGKDCTPSFVQALPCTPGPEGILAIPSRKLLVVASEVDDDEDANLRSTIAIYKLDAKSPFYPEILSGNDRNGLPIPWGAISGLANDRHNPDYVYAVTDSFYRLDPRILKIDVSRKPVKIVDDIKIRNPDGSTPINFDFEGIVQRRNGGFVLASEGRASDTASNPSRRNQLCFVSPRGILRRVVNLEAAVDNNRTNNGFEGVSVAYEGGREYFYAAIQREWPAAGDPDGCIRIARWSAGQGWRYVYFPKDAPTSPRGGWVGLSENFNKTRNKLLVIERDNQRGTNARIKQIVEVDLRSARFVRNGRPIQKLSKKLVRDLLPDLGETNGWIQDKVEGLTMGIDGVMYVCTDNDGVDDATGETLFFCFDDAGDGKKKGKKKEDDDDDDDEEDED